MTAIVRKRIRLRCPASGLKALASMEMCSECGRWLHLTKRRTIPVHKYSEWVAASAPKGE